MKYTSKASIEAIFNSVPTREKFECMFYGEAHRARKYDNSVFVYAKGASRYGNEYETTYFLAHCSEITYMDPYGDEATEKWGKRIKRAIKALEKSGLWPEKVEYFNNLLKMNLRDKKAINDIFWNLRDQEGALEPYVKKYPFVFSSEIVEGKSVLRVNTDYIWELSECQLKSMYFGKHNNAFHKERIANALASKTPYNVRERVNYDVSFEYNPEKNMAWYSEEYRDCGNGHYYIALDENTALFVEND